MFLMGYTSIRGEENQYYAKKATWDLLNSHIDVHIQMLIDEYPGYEVQDITRLEYQFSKNYLL